MVATLFVIMLWAYSALLLTSNGLAHPMAQDAVSTVTSGLLLVKRAQPVNVNLLHGATGAFAHAAASKPAAVKASTGILSHIPSAKSFSFSRASSKVHPISTPAKATAKVAPAHEMNTSPASSSMSPSSAHSRTSSSSSTSTAAQASPATSTTPSSARADSATSSHANHPSASPHGSPVRGTPTKASAKLDKDNKWADRAFAKHPPEMRAHIKENLLIQRGDHAVNKLSEAEVKVNHYRSKIISQGRSLDTLGGKLKSFIPGTLENKVRSNTKQVQKSEKQLGQLYSDIKHAHTTGHIADRNVVHDQIQMRYDAYGKHQATKMAKKQSKVAGVVPNKSSSTSHSASSQRTRF